MSAAAALTKVKKIVIGDWWLKVDPAPSPQFPEWT